MKHRFQVRSAAWFLATALGVLSANWSFAAERPNIIVVYTDQQRYDTLGCNGGQLSRTPVVDRLAGTARSAIIDTATIFLGLTVGASTQADV